jgi:hypothetical protein
MPRRRRHTGEKPPFRLSREARDADFAWLNALTEKDAVGIFRRLRWHETDGEPYCPECGSFRCRELSTRPGWWQCGEKGCRKQFSVTSGTVFHSRKLPFLKLVKLVFLFAASVKGMPALQLSFHLDCQYKSAYVNVQKLRQAMSSDRDATWLDGAIEVDGAYFGGKIRPANMKVDRVDRRKEKRKEDRERVVMVFRQEKGPTVAFAAQSEAGAVAVAAARALVRPGAAPVFRADGHAAYEDLEAFGELRVTDHSKGFVVDGISTNLAESFFARCRRGEVGSYHHMAPTWLDLYAGEMAWRENCRRVPVRKAMEKALKTALRHPVSRLLKGYWQHWELPDEFLERPELRWARVFGAQPGARPPPPPDVRLAA